MTNDTIILNRSEVNTLIASLLLSSVSYSSGDLKKRFPNEATKYSELENKLRELCYNGHEITGQIECKAFFD